MMDLQICLLSDVQDREKLHRKRNVNFFTETGKSKHVE